MRNLDKAMVREISTLPLVKICEVGNYIHYILLSALINSLGIIGG